MNVNDQYTTLTQIVTQSRHCVEQLKDNLQTELTSLLDNDADKLIELSKKKEALMLELHSLEFQRKNISKQNNIATKEEYILWLSQIDPTQELKNNWENLSKDVLECQQNNSRNSVIAENMVSASRQALNILNGTSEVTESTYGATGKKQDNANALHNTTA